MSNEHKPVICPWCGLEMFRNPHLPYSTWNKEKGEWEFEGQVNYACVCGAQSPIKESTKEAIEEATRRPPNRPLTLPELFDLDGNMDAVWVVDSGCGTVVMSAEEACEWASDADTVLFFVRKPTPADIEAARKELDCK